MSITVNETKQVLIDSGVEYLYHANTVATSVTFLLQYELPSAVNKLIDDKFLRDIK